MVTSISQGSKCDSVKIAKYLTGYSTKNASATYDEAFAKHVRSWKQSHGGLATDQIGTQTWALIADYAPKVDGSNKPAAYALRLALGLSESAGYNSTLKNIIKQVRAGLGLSSSKICDTDMWRKVLTFSQARNAHTINYKQNDKRWGSIIYSKSGKDTGQYISNSGCGPTSMASCVATLTSRKDITPVDMCDLAVRHGYRKSSGGTDTGFFAFASSLYGLRCVETTLTTVVKHCLDSGGIVICRFKAGSWWTSCGHFSPMWMMDSKYYYVDNTISSIKIKREVSKLAKDCKEYFCIYK